MRDVERMPIAETRRGGIVSFLLIGAGAALGFVVLSGLLVGLVPSQHAWIVIAACYASFILPVYWLHRRFTFVSEVRHLRAMPRYLAVQAMALVLATVFSFVFHGTLALPSLPSAMLVIVLTSGVNYMILKSWAFVEARKPLTAGAMHG